MESFEYIQAPDTTEYDSMGYVKNLGKAAVLQEFKNSIDKNFQFIENAVNSRVSALIGVDLPAFTSSSGGGNDSQFDPLNDQETKDIFGTR